MHAALRDLAMCFCEMAVWFSCSLNLFNFITGCFCIGKTMTCDLGPLTCDLCFVPPQGGYNLLSAFVNNIKLEQLITVSRNYECVAGAPSNGFL